MKPGLSVFALAASQTPLQAPNMTTDYSLKQGGSIFSPVDLITLGRPGAGVANPAGDLVLVPFSEYSFEDERYV